MYPWQKFPWTNTHGFNLDWVIQTVKECKEKVDDFATQISEFWTGDEVKAEIDKRKLTEDGDFNGTLCGKKKTVCEVVAEIDDNARVLKQLTDEFEDGQTGEFIDCGIFVDADIERDIDCGHW